jgi:crotonobetaine/carnitine-CoA ligase
MTARYFDGPTPTVPDRNLWTLAHVLRERARSDADRVFLVTPDEGTSYTYGQTYDLAESYASGLLADGAQQGDRVALILVNRSEFVLAWFACALAGLIEVPISTAYTGPLLRHQLEVIEPGVLIVDAECIAEALSALPGPQTLRRCYVVGDDSASVETGIAVLAEAGYTASPFAGLLTEQRAEMPAVSPRDVVAIFFTSGTTGPSKGVTMTNAHLYFFSDGYRAMTRLAADDVVLTVLPLFHGNAQFTAVYPALIAGAQVVVRRRFSASRWIDDVRHSGATVTNLLGMMMDLVGKQPESQTDGDNALRCVVAIPTMWSIAEAFKARFGVQTVIEAYGLTEMPNPIMTPYGESRPRGSAGLGVTDWYEILLVDPETDEPVDAGTPGELVVRPKVPWITMLGYWGMPQSTAEVFRNLWLHTGDLLRRSEDGWYYFVDRQKDCIRRRGENISSYEVEMIMSQLTGVQECAAIGVPAGESGTEEEVMIAFTRSPHATLEAQQVWAWAESQLPRFAVPRYVWPLEELPRTPTQRIQKKVLRERWLELGRPGSDREAADRSSSLG